jgi:hypothetical protein
MGSNRSVLGLTPPLLVLAVVPSALVSAGATRADAATCGSLNRATGPAAAGELSNAAFVSAGESWAAGNVGSALNSNRTLIDDPATRLDLNIESLCAHTVDYNSDGWPDLLVCGETGGLHLFDNDQGQGFTDVSTILGAQVNAVDAAMVDINHDHRPDPAPHPAAHVHARTDTNGLFSQWRRAVGRGAAPQPSATATGNISRRSPS